MFTFDSYINRANKKKEKLKCSGKFHDNQPYDSPGA